MRRLLQSVFGCLLAMQATAQTTFTPGNLVVLQTSGTASKASSAVTLKEITTSGSVVSSVAIPVTGPTPFQSAGIFGGSEGFLTTSTDNKFLVLGGYATASSISDITASSSSSVPRAVGLVYPSGFYLQFDTSKTFFSANDIRGAISDGTNFWASGASNASIDGIDYFGPGARAALATGSNPPKAYGMRIFNGQIYFSTQKAGPTNSATQLGIFALGTGMPTSGTVSVTQIINTGSVISEDFSFNATGDVCYIAINLNTSQGGIQKWTRSGSVWTLAYTLGTGITNTGAYGLVVDYSGTFPVIYATTFDAAGNRVIKITDNGSGATATTIVAAASNVYYKGISFAPVASGTPLVNLSVSRDTASEAGVSVITVTANASAPVTGVQTVSVAVSGTGITTGDYALSNTIITIPNGATSGSVTFTVVDDILGEGTETAVLTMSAPGTGIALGMRTVQRITIADNDGNNHPTISIDTSTSNYIDGAVTSSIASPFKLSGVISDPTDPAAASGVNFIVNDLETVSSSLTVWVAGSSNTTVVPLANVVLSGTDAIRNAKITPVAVGFSNITIKVSDGIDTTSFVINYGASAASSTPSATVWHTDMSDGSDGIVQNDSFYISADDELNVLNVYSRSQSGLQLKSYNYTSSLSLPNPGSPEVDIEAAALSPASTNKVYWMGSMSNGKSPFDNKPNRDRVFATTYSGTGAATTFAFNGYVALRSSLLSWGDANGYGFTASAAAGVDSKSPSGFAAEGMVFGPDNTTLYLGLRAPLVPTAARTKAVIAPIQNFETWFNNGAPSGSPTYGSPIELDLGGRGIRDITRLPNGTYVIIAGNPAGSPNTSAIYKWTGYAGDAPILVPASVSGVLNMEGVMPVNISGSLSLTSLQVITDNGDDILYNDGNEAKDFGDLIYRKFRSDMVTGIDLSFAEINVRGNGVTITDGTTAISTANNTDMGDVVYGNNTTTTFAIQNLGTADLNISGINFTGAASSDFSISGAPSYPLSIASGSTYTVTVSFSPGAIGVRNAVLNIASNDADEATYNFSIQGNGLCNTPVAYIVGGGGTRCADAAGFDITLSSSATDVRYQLYRGTTQVGAPMDGTGSALSFGIQTTAGVYTVSATDTTTACGADMTGSATIVVNELPLAQNVTGGGHYCATGSGVAVGLDNSQAGVNYTLYNGSSAIGTAVAGTGAAISFGNMTTTATYTVRASDAGTGCTNAMTGNAPVVIDPLPVVFSTNGGGNYCSGGTGVAVGLTGSENGVSYALYRGATYTGITLSSNGTALSFGNMTTGGTYTVSATNTTTGCNSSMTGSAVVIVNPLPVFYAVTGGGSYCSGTSGVPVGLGNSQSGINYQLYRGSSIVGSVVAGTSTAISLGAMTTAGSYSVQAVDATTGCVANMTGSVSVSVNPLPAIYAVTGGGSYCEAGTGVHIGLGGSAAGITYELFNGASSAVSTAGTGLPLDFGMLMPVGIYTVKATDNITACVSNMSGTVSVAITATVTPAVSVTSVPGTSVCAGTSVTFLSSATNGGSAPVYHWRVNGVVMGSSTSYTYTPANGDIVSVLLNSNAACTTIDSAANAVTMTVNAYTTPNVIIAATPGNILCEGSPVTFTSTAINGGAAPAYTWLKNSVAAGFGATYSYTPTDGDEIVLSMASSKPCVTSNVVYSNNINMLVGYRYLPAVTIDANPGTTIAHGTSVTLTARVTDGGPMPVYKWVLNGTIIPGATDSTYTSGSFENGDSVSCIVTGTGICGLQSYNSVVMSVRPVGISSVVNPDHFTIAPNPSNGEFYVRGATLANELSLTVANTLGQVVYTDNVKTQKGMLDTKIALDGNQAPGVYFLSVKSNSQQAAIFRMVVSK